MAAFLDGCRFNPTAGGTTDWTYSSPVPGYQNPAAAGAVNGTLYKYRAESADLSQWELGEGAYNAGTGVLARTTVLFNSSGTGIGSGQSGAGTKINFSTVPQVAIVALKEDLISVQEANSFTAAQQAQARQNVGINQAIAIGSGVDLNTITSPGTYWCSNANNTNGPTTGGQWYIDVLIYAADPANYIMQRATSLLADAITYTRVKVAGTWQAWQTVLVAGPQSLSTAQQAQVRVNLGFNKLPYVKRATTTFVTDATSSTDTVYRFVCTAGGGGGGGANGSTAAGAGGGAGGTTVGTFTGIAAGATVTIVTGGAGGGGSTAGGNGTAGGNSSISATGITTITSNGGGGGGGITTTVAGSGLGGSGTSGATYTSINGGDGLMGVTAGPSGGAGGASYWGGGGANSNAAQTQNGRAGVAPGSGGSGGCSIGGAGGAGAPGLIEVVWVSVQ